MSNPDSDSQTQSMLTLPNGCLCCSVKDMGIAAIEEMVAAQREKIDWVLVELTGVADPGELRVAMEVRGTCADIRTNSKKFLGE